MWFPAEFERGSNTSFKTILRILDDNYQHYMQMEH
jgi:hypothetical protein